MTRVVTPCELRFVREAAQTINELGVLGASVV